MIALRRFVLLLAAVVWLPGCSWFSSDEASKPAPLVAFTPQAKLERQWFDGVGDQGDEALYLRLTPAIDGGVIYAASAKGDVRAIARNSGSDLWHAKVGEPVIGAVGAGQGLVFVATASGLLVALHAENGAEAWRFRLSSEMLAAAQAAEQVVIAQTIDGRVVGLDSANGTLRWQYKASIPVLTLRTAATPVIENGVAYLAFPSGKVVALDVNKGLQLWEQQVTLPEGRNELERMIDFDGRPLLSGDDLYVAGYQGRVAMLDKDKGTVSWSEKISTMGHLAFGNGNLYLTQSDDTVVALKMATGRRLWENSLMARRQLTAPVVIGEYVAVADFDGVIHLLNQSDGQFAGRYELWRSQGVRTPLQSDDTTLYVLTNSGRLTALRLDH